jgi:hypothetical protein
VLTKFSIGTALRLGYINSARAAMKLFAVICATALALPLAGQDSTADDRLVAGNTNRPPVLQGFEPPDNLVLTLPGAPAPKAVPITPPIAPPLTAPDPEDADDHRPVLRRAPKPILPAEFERESAAFCQKMIDSWTAPDAYNLFGEPLRERTVAGTDGVENGRVYAYSDPTGRYREIELDFAKDTGVLRSVFVYPWKMSWTECRKLWGGIFHSTQANKGRIFYSYVNRRLDVLVDGKGNVISLGLY